MQFLNDDSNEWMRKAAEDYPVKPFGMNWEVVASQLADVEPAKERVGYILLRYAAMVVFFMMLSLVCNKYLRMDFDNRYATKTNNTNSQQPAIAEPVLVKSDQSFTNKVLVNKSVAAVERNSVVEQELDDAVLGRSRAYSPAPNQNLAPVFSPVPAWDEPLATLEGATLSGPTLPEVAAKGTKESNEVEPKTKTSDGKNGFLTKKRFYAGLVAGPDFSSVKFQKSTGVGFNAGLLLGYRLSPRWQLESGVLLNRKEYYSSGEYFKSGSVYLPSHAYITKVDGYCTMFEIPVNLRYNISQKKQTNWFAVAGLSSYLMNKEDYNYTYKRYNVEYKGSKVYRDLSKEWLTVVNASIGYEKAISEKVQIRLEPYLKLPLGGMGTGKLPISSAGMNVGISYPIK